MPNITLYLNHKTYSMFYGVDEKTKIKIKKKMIKVVEDSLK